MPDIANLFVFPFFLIFLRMGSAIMVFPGFSDVSISPRIRLLIALFVSLALFPLLEPTMPTLPDKKSVLVGYIFVEMFIGIALAISGRLFMAALNTAGELIGYTSGLHAASLFDPRSGASTAAPALFLSITAVTLIFVTNLHHTMIEAVVESYAYFPVGELPELEDTAFAITKVIADMFRIGIKIAAPVMVIGFLTYVAFGIFNRLIPQLHVFFVALPITIAGGIFVLGVAVSSMITLFMDELTQRLVLMAV
jgi:flagellar biosynthetic protein FliR